MLHFYNDVMLVRTQVQLEATDHAKIKNFANRHGISMSAAVRLLIRKGLGETDSPPPQAWDKLLAFAGSGREPDEAQDVAREHDKYLYDDV